MTSPQGTKSFSLYSSDPCSELPLYTHLSCAMMSGRLEFMKDSAKMSSLKMFLFMSSTVTPRLWTYSLSSCGVGEREREVRLTSTTYGL